MLRFGADVGQVGCLRYSATRQEGILRARLQWRPGGTALGLEAAGIRRHADNHRLHQDPEDVLQIAQLVDGRARGAQARDVAK